MLEWKLKSNLKFQMNTNPTISLHSTNDCEAATVLSLLCGLLSKKFCAAITN